MRSIRFIRKKLVHRGETREYVVGYGCTECAWQFNMERPLHGSTVSKAMNGFNDELDEEFERHDCSKYPKVKS
jgi:hypothetical protein